MKKMNYKSLLFFSICIAFAASSCKRTPFQEAILEPSEVYFNQTGGVYQVAVNDQFTKDADKITIPINITMSTPASTTFTVNIVQSQDVASQAIIAGSLTNTIAMPAASVITPSFAEISFGNTKTAFNLVISRTVIELNYGKKLAVGITLGDATKGNKVSDKKKSLVVILNTSEIIALSDVHYISFGQTGIFNVSPTNTTKDLSAVNMTFPVNLSGSVGKGFAIRVSSNADTVNNLIANGTLPNTRLLSDNSFLFPQSVSIGQNLTGTAVQVSVKINDLLTNYSTKWAFAITLNNPERYQVLSSNKTIVVVIDPLTVLDDITLLLKNTSQPFVYSSLDPVAKRWGVISDWITNAAVNTYQGVVSYGSYDTNNSSNISLESFNTAGADRPNITNGKIYQTVTLPPGKYKFDVNLRSGSAATTCTVYSVVSKGSTMPDVTAVSANSLGFLKFTATTGLYSVPFTVTATTQIAVGFSGTVVQNNSFNINSVKLYRIL